MSENATARFDRLRSEGGFFPLPARARFAVTGADRDRYLNGQVSNDLRKLVPGRAMQACILSAKGRLDAVLWISTEANRLVVESDAELAEALAARLERYVVADDVEVAPLPETPTWHVFGAAAAAFPDALQVPRLNLSGVDLATRPDGLLEATEDEWEALRIERLVPRWGKELGPDTLPVEAGLDATAVDFHKGCYIGQEVVSRIRSVGHANRALRAFDLVAGPTPAVGAEFFLDVAAARAAAAVTSVHFALSRVIGLCYIRRGTDDGATLTAAAGDSRIHLRHPDRPHA